MDYRRFLTRTETQDLVWFGGRVVELGTRRVRLDPDAPRPEREGWVRFEVGRYARAIGPGEPRESALDAAPAVRGHLLGDRLVTAGARAEELFARPADELPRFSPVLARRWPSGALVFHRAELESEVEEEARRALEDGRGLRGLAGVPATLRAAFGLTRGLLAARRIGVPVSPIELLGAIVELSEAEDSALAERVVSAIAGARASGRGTGPRGSRVGRADELEDRAARALEPVGAELLDLRLLEGELAEVTWRFLDQRFLSVVERRDLRIVDAGVCLDGHDERLTLASLPGVVREGAASGQLVLTRWAEDRADR